MLLLYVGALAYWGDVPWYASLDQAIEAHPEQCGRLGRERVGAGGAALGRVLRRPRGVCAGPLGQADSLWALLAMGAGNLAIFYNVSLALSCFRIPRGTFADQVRSSKPAFQHLLIKY